jgi:hypothetical protein
MRCQISGAPADLGQKQALKIRLSANFRRFAVHRGSAADSALLVPLFSRLVAMIGLGLRAGLAAQVLAQSP